MKRVLLILTLLAVCEGLSAQTVMPFLRDGRDPAAMGLAGASSAGFSAYSAFGDPSAAALSEGRVAAGVSYRMWAPQLAPAHHAVAGVTVRPVEALVLSLGWSGQSAGSSERAYGSAASGYESWRLGEQLVSLGAGVRLSPSLSAGVAVRYAAQRLTDRYVYGALAFDGFMTFARQDWRVGAGIVSFGPPVVSRDGATFALPASARLSGLYGLPLTEDQRLEAFLEADAYFHGAVSASAGLQYGWRRMLFARAGYRYGSEASPLPAYASLGAGVRIGDAITLDLAWLTLSETLSNTIQIGIACMF